MFKLRLTQATRTMGPYRENAKPREPAEVPWTAFQRAKRFLRRHRKSVIAGTSLGILANLFFVAWGVTPLVVATYCVLSYYWSHAVDFGWATFISYRRDTERVRIRMERAKRCKIHPDCNCMKPDELVCPQHGASDVLRVVECQCPKHRTIVVRNHEELHSLLNKAKRLTEPTDFTELNKQLMRGREERSGAQRALDAKLLEDQLKRDRISRLACSCTYPGDKTCIAPQHWM